MESRKNTGRGKAGLQDFHLALERAVETLPSLMVAAGECDFLRGEAVDNIRYAWLGRYPDGDLCVIRGLGEARPATLSDVLAEVSGGSLFAREKLVMVRQAEKILFPAGRSDDAAAGARAGREKAFMDMVDTPPFRIWLLLETASLPGNRNLAKKILTEFTQVPCPVPNAREVPEWLARRARSLGKRLDDEAGDLLYRAHGRDLGLLAGEVEKLSLFAGDRETIDAGMVREFLTGTIEFDIFSFTNAVEAKNLAQAAHFARRIALQGTRDERGKKDGGERSAHRVMAMLAGTVQGLLRARLAVTAGLRAPDFAAQERISPWRAARLMESAGNFELKELRLMVRHAADQMRRVHDTGGDVLLALETMAVRCTTGRAR